MTTEREYACKKCKAKNDYTVDDLSLENGRSGGYDDLLTHRCNHCGYGNAPSWSFPENDVYEEWRAKYSRW